MSLSFQTLKRATTKAARSATSASREGTRALFCVASCKRKKGRTCQQTKVQKSLLLNGNTLYVTPDTLRNGSSVQCKVSAGKKKYFFCRAGASLSPPSGHLPGGTLDPVCSPFLLGEAFACGSPRRLTVSPRPLEPR